MDPAPSLLRRLGPALLFAGLAADLCAWWTGARHAPPVALLAALVTGVLLFPPGRHAHRARYDGTVWTVRLGLFLILAGYLGQLCTIVAIGLGAGFLAGFAGRPLVATPEFTATLIFAATMCTAAAAFLALMVLRLRGNEWWAVGLQPQGFWAALWIGAQSGLVLAGFKLVYFKMFQTLGVWQLEGAGVVQVMFALDQPRHLVLGLLVGAVLVPIAEEVLFRGVLFAALRRRSGPVAAAILSSLLFGALHDEHVFPTLLGLTFALLYHRTGSLWTSIGAHMLVNAVTLGMTFSHGALIEGASWTTVGALIVTVALCQLAAIRRAAAAPVQCACGTPAPVTNRCGRCCFPLDAWPWGVTAFLRLLSALTLVSLGGLACSASWFIARPYDHERSAGTLALQYHLLESGGNPAAQVLLDAWDRDRPGSEDVRGLRLALAYRREDYAQVVKLVEARYPGPASTYSAQDLNMLSLALAEMGGGHLHRAVELGVQAVAKAEAPVRSHYEDTLGWAYVRAGDLAAAKRLLDREPEIYGRIGKNGMAEICYHRGVVLWALGERDRAVPLLETALRMGADGRPFSQRSAAILKARALPAGLVGASTGH